MPYAPHLPYDYEESTVTLSREPASTLLSPEELQALSDRVGANADRWLKERFQSSSVAEKPITVKRDTGRKPKVIDNPFFGFIGCTTYWGRYPVFALDIIEGIARLDWHDRDIDEGGKSMPLSVRNLTVILESLPVVTNAAVMSMLRLEERHARRYVKAIEMIVPRMMKYRPKSLKNEMEGIEPEPKPSEWGDDLPPPSPEELAKLHHDLRTLTEYATAEEYESEHDAEVWGTSSKASNILAFPERQQHPKRHEVLSLRAQGVSIKAVARQTGVARNTIKKWDQARLAA